MGLQEVTEPPVARLSRGGPFDPILKGTRIVVVRCPWSRTAADEPDRASSTACDGTSSSLRLYDRVGHGPGKRLAVRTTTATALHRIERRALYHRCGHRPCRVFV